LEQAKTSDFLSRGPSVLDPLVSVVVPVYCEQDNISPLIDQIVGVMAPLDLNYEILVVDDGSTDLTWQRLTEKAAAVDQLEALRLSRNFGHQGALLAGLNAARGQAVISMDGDLQHPPELLPQMIAAWQAGSRVVITKREDEQKTSLFKRLTSKYFYKIFSFLAETSIESGTSDFRLLDRRALDALLGFRFGQPFLRGSIPSLGFQTTTIPFSVGERLSGESKYTPRKMFDFARRGIISHSSVPLRIGIWLGLVTGIFAVFELVYIFVQYAQGNTVPGWASTLGLTAFLFAVLFMMSGIVGLYIEDIHRILKQQPHFIVSDSTADKNGRGHRENQDDRAERP